MQGAREGQAADRPPALRARTALPRTLALLIGLVAASLFAPVARVATAQMAYPVYMDDSPASEDGLARIRELAAAGNEAEAVRVLQAALDNEGDRVTAIGAGDPELFISVRARAHELLLANPRLLERYRDAEDATARRMLDAGRAADVERTHLLTPSGYAAALRVAGERLEAAKFWGAALALRQLDRHPDRATDGGAAAALLARVAPYLDDKGVWALADKWATEAGVAPATGDARRAIRGPSIAHGVTPMDSTGMVELSGLLSKPLWSEALEGKPGALDELPEPEQQADGAPFSTAVALRVFPTVSGDTIYINTGEDVSAWDRLTLTPRWARKMYAEVGAPDGGRGAARFVGGAFKDTSSVTAWGPWLAYTTGIAREARREGDARVHLIDAATGRDAWSTAVATLDPTLAESWVRGPAIIDEGVVIVAAVKHSQQRRLSSVQLVGLDVATGDALWRRPLGSAGSLPYGASPIEAADAGIVRRGVTIRSDRVGVITAVETGTGRAVWARRVKPEPIGRRESQPWEAHAPVLLGDRVYTLSPDRRRVLELDAETGEELGSISAQRMGSPEYLLVAGDALVGVSAEGVWALDPPLGRSDPEPAADAQPGAAPAPGVNRAPAEANGAQVNGAEPAPRKAWRVAKVDVKPNIRGRVVAAGDSVIVPLVDGALVAPVRPGSNAEARRVRLDRPGVIVALPDQLVVADDWQLHTYLLWEVAEKMLAARIAAQPDDPTPAVTYAELAHRAGRGDAILPAADLAIAAIGRAEASEATDAARRRLFRALMSMLEDSAATTAVAAPGEAASRPISLTDAIRAGAIERASSLAASAEERVAALMAAGAFAEARGDAGSAIGAYQSALADSALASATVVRRNLSSRADLEASRRLRRVVREHGSAVYAAYEAEAARSLDAILAGRQGQPTADSLEALARRYPVAAASAKALDQAALFRETAGEGGRAALILEEGLLTLADSLSRDAALAGELTGRLVRTLERAGRLRAALDALERSNRERPGLALTERGSPIDAGALRESLHQRTYALERRPRVGPLVAEQTPQTLAGWEIVRPVTGGECAPAAHVVLIAQSGEIGLFRPAEDGRASGVMKAWSVPGQPLRKVARVDSRAVYLSDDVQGERRNDAPPQAFSPTGGRTIQRLDAATGQALWTTAPFRSLFPERGDRRLEQAAAGRAPLITTPTGSAAITDLIVLFDQRTCALVERSGRAAGIDLDTGAVLWTLERTAWRVHDAWLDAGALAIGGADAPLDDRDDRQAGEPVTLALDVRTGRTLHRESAPLGQVRWVRVTPSGRVVTGHDGGLSCADAQQGRSRWRVSATQARSSAGAWAFDGRLIVLDESDMLWQVEEDDGRIRDPALDARGMRHPGEIVARPIGERAALSTNAGLAIFGRDGAVVGRDARWAAGESLPALWCDGLFLSLDASSANPAAPNVYGVRTLSETSAATLSRQTVALGANKEGPQAAPEAMAAVDGRVLISAGDVTIVYDAPAMAPGGAPGAQPAASPVGQAPPPPPGGG